MYEDLKIYVNKFKSRIFCHTNIYIYTHIYTFEAFRSVFNSVTMYNYRETKKYTYQIIKIKKKKKNQMKESIKKEIIC